MSLLFDYYRAVLALVEQALAAGQWWLVVACVLALLAGIAVFFVVLGFIGARLSSPFGSEGGGRMGLLVAVAVVAILAAIALPQYEQYRRRAAIAAGYLDLKTAQQGVDAYLLQTQQWPATLDEAGMSAPASENHSLSLGDGGLLTVVFSAPDDLAGRAIQLVYDPQAEFPWSCVTDLDGALLPEDVRADCQQAGQETQQP